MNILSKIKLKFVTTLWKYVFFYIKKAKQIYYSACYRKLYILTSEIFPDNSLGENSELAFNLTDIYIYDSKNNLTNLNVEKFNNLKLVADSDEWIKKAISDFYRIISFSFIFNTDSKNKYFEKARVINQLVEPIKNFKEVIKLVNDVKKDSNIFLKKVREISEKRCEEELNNKIPPVKISSENITFLLTIFSTFFLISGIIYSKVYFHLLGINISDFFSISDYLASSIDVLMYTFLSMIFYWRGFKSRVKIKIHENQFNIQTNKKKTNSYMIILLNIIFISTFCMNYYINNIFMYTLLYVPLYSIFFILYDLIPIWKYVENPLKVDFIVSSFFTFSILLILTAFSHSDQILRKEIKDDNYKIVFQNESENDKNLIFITSNSTSVFLLSTDTKKVKMIPLDSIVSIEKK